MRVCFFSDVHGNILAFRAFLEQIKQQEIDEYIFGGDVFGYYYHADEILDLLREKKILCLLGNHDKMFLDVVMGEKDENSLIQKYGNSYKQIVSKIKPENIAFLKTLSPFFEMKVDGCGMGFFHGGPRNPLDMRIYPDAEIKKPEELELFEKYDYVFVGHTHHKMQKRAGKCLIVNPGSLGQQRDGRGCSYVIFDTTRRNVEFYTVAYDRESLVAEIKSNDEQQEMQNKLIEVLYRNRRTN